jgi:hypothetical protein
MRAARNWGWVTSYQGTSLNQALIKGVDKLIIRGEESLIMSSAVINLLCEKLPK